MGLLPLLFRVQASKRCETGFRPMNGAACAFLQQNEANPKSEYRSRQSCEYDKHSQKFLHHVEIHCKPHSIRLLMTFSKP
jgi:hypothetical protein